MKNIFIYKYKKALIFIFFLVFSSSYAEEIPKKISESAIIDSNQLPLVDIEVSISSPKIGIYLADKEEKILVRFFIKNNSDKFIRFLSWKTPLETTLSKGVFEVKRGNKKIEYIGRMVKRGTPLDKDYFTLEPKESVAKIIDLRAVYNFIDSGRYTVTLQPMSIKLKDSIDRPKGISLLKSTVILNIM